VRPGSAAGFDVLFSIDVASGRLARLGGSGVGSVDAFGGDPLAAARSFVEAGARWIHVVDVDLALTGEPRNIGLLERIALLDVRVQASGGIATMEAAAAALEAGAERVVLGSAALADRATVSRLTGEMGERLVVGLEVEGDRIRPRGARRLDLPLAETLEWLGTTGAARFVVTAVTRVGSLGGPDLPAIGAVCSLGRPVLAAGGIASIEDLRSVADAGAAGAIVGTAALEGALDLVAALALDGERR
jgi:phosphoribosylformimino-5-aminoimidazole carboxamide ribonucleotide (ProFAR) isomerase